MRAWLTLGFSMCLIVRAAAGQEHGSPPAPPRPALTLDDALSEALEKNPGLIVLRRQFDAARHRPAQDEALPAPTFEAQIWQWPLRTVQPADTNMYMFTVTQQLPGRGKRQLRAAIAAKDAETANADIAVRAGEIVDDVKRTYAELFVARKAVDIHRANAELLHQFADVSSVKYETGRIPQQDVLKAVLEISKLHDDLLMLEQRTRLAAARLNTLLDRAPDAPIGPLGEPDERALLTPLEELQQLALNRQPELRVARAGVDRAQAQLAAVAREYKPDFSISGGYMLLPRERDAWTGSLGISWPSAPWARGKLDAQKAEASAQIDTARARQRATANQIRLAVHEAYVQVKTAEQRVALLRTTIIPQSEQTLESARLAYQSDRVDLLSLIDGQRTVLEARMNYYRALSDLSQARADLERATGIAITPAMLGPIPVMNEAVR